MRTKQAIDEIGQHMQALEAQIKSVIAHPQYSSLLAGGFYDPKLEILLADALKFVQDAVTSHKILKESIERNSSPVSILMFSDSTKNEP